MLSKKQKTTIGVTVGAVVLAAAIAVTVYFVTSKKSPAPSPAPSGPTWACVDDGQGSSMLLYNNVPCAKYLTDTVCQAAANAGTVTCSCPTSPLQVLQGTACVPVCLDVATWDNTQNKCVCPAGQQFNGTKCDKVCSPPFTVDETTGKASGYYDNNGVCTNVNTVTTKVPYLDTLCQKTPCQVPSVCTGNDVYFTGFDPATQSCVPPNSCNGKSFFYTWPDGSNTCPGFTYEQSPTGTCVPPDDLAIQVACEFSAGGCEPGSVPIQPGTERCTGSGSCRPANATAQCPTGSVVNTQQCGASGKGICYSSNSGKCSPAWYDCSSPNLPCPSGTSLASACSTSSVGPCGNNQGQCVATLVGCRPDQEQWTYNNGVCTNQTVTTGLTLIVDTRSTVNQVTVEATVPASYTVPLLSLQFRYTLVLKNGASPQHWSGVVSNVQPSSTNNKQVTLTFYPDQSVLPVPAGVTLDLLIVGLLQSYDGSWTPSISSPDFSDASVTTCVLQAGTPACLPTVGFSPNKALELVPQLSNLSPLLQKTVAVTSAATELGLGNASTVPFSVGTSFAGAVSPVATLPYGAQSVSQMFVVLAWTALNSTSSNGAVTYVVNKNNVPLYKGPLTTLVDTVNVTANDTTTYSVQAQTSSTCTSQPQFTTCPPLAFSGQMCTSLKNSSPSIINFMIPDPTGACINIPSGSERDAAFYSCVYLQNKNRALSDVQVPSSDYTQCLQVVPVTNGVMVNPLNETVQKDGVTPSGYCKDASCTQGYSNIERSAVCACGGSASLCNQLKDQPQGLPFVQLGNGEESMTAKQFSTGMNGLVNFVKRYPELLF